MLNARLLSDGVAVRTGNPHRMSLRVNSGRSWSYAFDLADEEALLVHELLIFGTIF